MKILTKDSIKRIRSDDSIHTIQFAFVIRWLCINAVLHKAIIRGHSPLISIDKAPFSDSIHDMNTNPYDVDTSAAEVTYFGLDNGFFCFMINLSDCKGLEGCMFEMEVSQWLFENTNRDDAYMGNEFPYPDHPRVKLANPTKNRIFVIFKKFADVAQFENTFRVNGLTPTMLV